MKPTLHSDGAAWTLPHSLKKWIDLLPVDAASSLANVVEKLDLDVAASNMHLDSVQIAAFSESVALALGLPRNSSLAFDIRLSGVLGNAGASLEVRWLQPGKTLPARNVESKGCWLAWSGITYRIADPVFTALKLVNDFNACNSAHIEEQFRVWAHIRKALGDSQSEMLTDRFLRSFRVVVASYSHWASPLTTKVIFRSNLCY